MLVRPGESYDEPRHHLLLRRPFSHPRNIVLALRLLSFLMPVIVDTVVSGCWWGNRERGGGGRVLLDHQRDSDRNSQDVQDGKLTVLVHILYKIEKRTSIKDFCRHRRNKSIVESQDSAASTPEKRAIYCSPNPFDRSSLTTQPANHPHPSYPLRILFGNDKSQQNE